MYSNFNKQFSNSIRPVQYQSIESGWLQFHAQLHFIHWFFFEVIFISKHEQNNFIKTHLNYIQFQINLQFSNKSTNKQMYILTIQYWINHDLNFNTTQLYNAEFCVAQFELVRPNGVRTGGGGKQTQIHITTFKRKQVANWKFTIIIV